MINGVYIREIPLDRKSQRKVRWMVTVNGKEWEQVVGTRPEIMNMCDRIRTVYPKSTLRVFSEVNLQQRTLTQVAGFSI